MSLCWWHSFAVWPVTSLPGLCAVLPLQGPKEIKLSAWWFFGIFWIQRPAYNWEGLTDWFTWSCCDVQGCACGSRGGSGICNWHPEGRFRLWGLSGFIFVWLKQWMCFGLLLLLQQYCVPKPTSSTERFSSKAKLWKFLFWECLVQDFHQWWIQLPILY